ncbi:MULTISPECIES: YdeI/OmpD-associated family protein [unclassified Acidovorax]|uniref:YdeI/OmpD-associated family protein n=1 Tax=unclassified Acidovorax TaxID=2684926 RepID=UPI000A5C85B1|nr:MULTISPECIES: YdeI/OmpD-associated family protein [unclassified Acidovorax]
MEAARSDGRWAAAYAGSATTVMPKDFLAALLQHPAAHAFYVTLKRQSLFTIYHRLHSAKQPETRQKRMAEFVGEVGAWEKPLIFTASVKRLA